MQKERSKKSNSRIWKKETGWLKNPKKSAYNKVYSKTLFSLTDLLK